MPGGRQPALPCVQHVQPGEDVAVEGLHAHLDLAVVTKRDTVPDVQCLLIDLGNVVQDDEHSVPRLLDDRGQRPVPPHVFTAEGQPPALQPPRSPLW
jgi:hypothetical protein